MLEIVEANDAGRAVGGAAIMPRCETINAKHIQASAGELAKSRASHHAKTTNDDVKTWHPELARFIRLKWAEEDLLHAPDVHPQPLE